MIYTEPNKLSDLKITQAVVERRKAIFASQSIMAVDDASRGKNKDIVGGRGDTAESATIFTGSLMRGIVDENTFDEVDIKNRSYSSAELKFQDASLGGNYCINPRPQYTRYADIRVKGKIPGRPDVSVMLDSNGSGYDATVHSVGMGEYYSKAIDDTSQVILMRFGVPEFNSLTQFFTSFYNEDAARVARTGRVDSVFFSLGNAAGMVVSVMYWPLLVAHALGAGLKFLFKKPSSRFYNLKPTMPIYWNAVTTMVNQIGVYKGLYPAELGRASTNQPIDDTMKVDKETMQAMNEAMPDIFAADGGIDVAKVASRAQHLKNVLDKIMYEAYNNSETIEGFVQKVDGAVLKQNPKRMGIKDMITSWVSQEVAKVNKDATVEKSMRVSETGEPPPEPRGFGDFLNNMFDDALDWASFKVDYTGPVSESFSSTVVESDLASKLNQTSAASKSAYFSFAGGNVFSGADKIVGAATDFAKGALNSFGASGLVSLAGSAFVDIPKHWENSTANMPRSNYTMQLVSPYGNPLSQMINMYIPLCMILTAALPKSAGKQAYTWPFLVELYDVGRAQTRLGMIDSVSVTRGITNLGFNKDKNPLGIEVSFSIVDMSSIMSMPVSAGFSLNPKEGVTDDENLYSDYLNILASVDMSNQIYFLNKMKLRAIQRMRNYRYFFTQQNAAAFLRNLPGISSLDVFWKGTER